MKPNFSLTLMLCCILAHPAAALATLGAGRPAVTPPDPVGAGGMVQVVLGLLLVIGMIVGVAWLTRRFGNFQADASGALRVIGGLSMGPRERVVLVQVGDRQLLLGVAPGRVSTLHVLDQPLVPLSPSAPANDSFAARLAGLLKQGKPA
jgi:flagellar protein FliO/FliZ